MKEHLDRSETRGWETPALDFGDKYPAAPGYMKQSETSRQAAEEITLAAGTLRRLIYNFIKERNGGATCDEAEVALNLRHQTASARITELRLAGKLRPAGTRATRSGRQADVLVAL